MSEHLSGIGAGILQAFREKKRLLAFDEYYELFLEQPTQQARNTAQYLSDMFAYFGTAARRSPHRTLTRYRLFDGVRTDDPSHAARLRAGERLVGHEEVQEQIARILNAFVRERRVNRLILLHGPNGSAKSTLIACVLRALRAYSRCPEGALYRFAWVFPRRGAVQKGIGFGEANGARRTGVGSYAYLADDEVDSRLACEVCDHPLFLIPGPERRRVIEALRAERPEARDFVPSDYIAHGDLCHKCRQIYEALLQSYQGDYAQVLRHVQVERFFIDPRYRNRAVTVEPQMRVDAGLHQLSMDASLGALPPSLKHLSLFAPHGDLIDANRGVVEYNDLLKRPFEAWKYLLSTCEKSSVSLENMIVFLDAVFLGSTNDAQLDAFKESAEFVAFKGRIELVRTPYLLDYSQEQEIYEDALEGGETQRHVAPHTARVAALWAVLTRLRQPRAAEYPKDLAELVPGLTPLQKAELYATGRPPVSSTEEEAKLLRQGVRLLRQDGERNQPYEGRVGASPRELKMVLLHAAQDQDHACVSPLAVIKQLRSLVEDPSLYPFLQVRPEGAYLAAAAFIDVVRDDLLDHMLEELQHATGLVSPSQHEELFDRYVLNVTHWIRNEKIRNRITGEHEAPSESLMAEVEKHLQISGKPADFRHSLIGRIGAWRVDHPDAAVDYAQLFPGYLHRIKESYFDTHRKGLAQSLRDFLTVHGEDPPGRLQDAERQARMERMLRLLCDELGYCRHCAVDAAAVVLRERVEPPLPAARA